MPPRAGGRVERQRVLVALRAECLQRVKHGVDGRDVADRSSGSCWSYFKARSSFSFHKEKPYENTVAKEFSSAWASSTTRSRGGQAPGLGRQMVEEVVGQFVDVEVGALVLVQGPVFVVVRRERLRAVFVLTLFTAAAICSRTCTASMAWVQKITCLPFSACANCAR